MTTVPTDGSNILLLTRTHGVTEAHFVPGGWHDYLEGREYDGAVWVCGDDAWQIEIEETPEGMCHGEAIGWLPRDALPEPDIMRELLA
jgi:hypothetical protein